MSDAVFGDDYAEQYDVMYGGKDYAAECDYLEAAFRRFGSGPTKTLVDVGCGTGNHSIPLARRGYQVTGVDLAPAMLARARRKAAEPRPSQPAPAVTFETGDMRTFHLGRTFDAALLMFAGLGYQTTNEAVRETFQNIRRHLRPGGLFISDFWFGPAVLAIRPSDQVKRFDFPGGQLIRFATGRLDILSQTAEISFRLWSVTPGRPVAETNEVHRVRYFFPQEIGFLLKSAGLEVRHWCAFPHLDRPADETSWNVGMISRAV